ncbi:1,2-phenylacetyl-CoA epoxidase subunit PaaD [Halorarius litoreus]|uniref:1,2-phenylacetyl-CoA epoxidase subunit PaaD n=1 Tax=Halorarius litoreus TaxID=2962676 RepID=UPI0020CF7D80|nr:1,2-phenylacetyl-CoA epoxidase subunit PaaD [Halorarius litoreus]
MSNHEFESEDPRYCGYTDYREGVDPADLPATGKGSSGVERRVWDALYEVEDPEMPVSIVDLGLIYGVEVDDGHARVRMTLTYTGCPARNMLLDDVEEAAVSAEGVDSAEVDLVWSPEWNLNLVTEAGKQSLREFGVSI